jgi:hypothetical protein
MSDQEVNEMSCLEITSTIFTSWKLQEILEHLKFRFPSISWIQTGFFTVRVTLKGPKVAMGEMKKEIDAYNGAIDARY